MNIFFPLFCCTYIYITVCLLRRIQFQISKNNMHEHWKKLHELCQIVMHLEVGNRWTNGRLNRAFDTMDYGCHGNDANYDKAICESWCISLLSEDVDRTPQLKPRHNQTHQNHFDEWIMTSQTYCVVRSWV